MMYALPKYFLNDILKMQRTLESFKYDTEYLDMNLDAIDVGYAGSDDKVGEFKRSNSTDGYTFWINEATLEGLSEGEL